MKAKGTVHKFGDNVDTDVIIPARYLNKSDEAWLASHCMEDIDADFVNKVKPGDIMVAEANFGCGSSREHAPIAIKASGISCVIASTLCIFLVIIYPSSIFGESCIYFNLRFDNTLAHFCPFNSRCFSI